MVETRLRGSRAIYEPGVMAGRLSHRLLGVELNGRRRTAAGMLMRWPYGAAWGMGLSALGRRPSVPLTAAALGFSVWVFELMALPLSGATPPLRRWSAEAVWTDLANTLAYGAVTALALARLERVKASRDL